MRSVRITHLSNDVTKWPVTKKTILLLQCDHTQNDAWTSMEDNIDTDNSLDVIADMKYILLVTTI